MDGGCFRDVVFDDIIFDKQADDLGHSMAWFRVHSEGAEARLGISFSQYAQNTKPHVVVVRLRYGMRGNLCWDARGWRFEPYDMRGALCWDAEGWRFEPDIIVGGGPGKDSR